MARMGDASKELARIGGQFQLVLTSPPYYGVTNYRLDNWIRLWMLGGPNLPDYETSQKFSNQVKYRHLLESVFGAVHRHLADDGVLYVRTDSRTFTRNTTVRVLRDLWPTHSFFWHAEGHGKSQTDLFGGKAAKPGETDILATTDDTLVPKEFTEVPQDLGDTDHEHRSPAHPDDMSETAL